MPNLSFIISLYRFTTPSYFKEGHVLTAGEADALNDVWLSVVREHGERIVGEALAKTEDGILSMGELRDLQSQLDRMEPDFLPKVRRDRLSAMEQEEREVRRDMPTAGEEEVGEEARRRVRARMRMSVKDIVGPL